MKSDWDCIVKNFFGGIKWPTKLVNVSIVEIQLQRMA
jgi:hypothetical protein